MTPIRVFQEPIFIGEGGDGSVYQISDNMVAKISRNNSTFHEEQIAKKLYSQGFPVPIPYGIYNINIYSEKLDSFVMEYFPDSSHPQSITHQMKSLIVQSMDMGYKPGKDALLPSNFLVSKEGKLIMIDFANWKHLEITQ